MSILLPHLTSLTILITQMAQEKVEILRCFCMKEVRGQPTLFQERMNGSIRGKASLNVWKISSTVGFFDAFVIFSEKRSRYFRQCIRSA